MQGYRTHTTYTGSLGYNSVRYFTSRIGWVSLKGLFRYRCNPGKLYKTSSKDQPPPSNRSQGIKTFRWDQRLHLHNFFMVYLNGYPDEITLGQQYNIREKPPVILYTYIINRHAGTPERASNNRTGTMQYTIKHGSSKLLLHRL